MDKSEREHTALVSGGSRGIGRAVCERLAQKGYSVCIGYVGNEKAAQETLERCRDLAADPGQHFGCVRADVGTKEGAEDLVTKAQEALGSIEVLVNCAGITRDGLLLSAAEEDIRAVLDTNLTGTILVSKAAARQMLRQRYGRIISLSSVVGLHGNAGQCAYAAAKAGIVGFTKSLAKELARKGITVNAVAPGMIDTDMTAAMPERAKEAALSAIPMGRMGTAQEAAEAVVFFASEKAGYLTGQVLCADGGMGM
ncbi:MAG: beta-ketoacyl-ACP reductase [Lachnospiraceae bacterium]